MPRDTGGSLPIGYAAISFVAPRRRRAIGWVWLVGVMLAIAVGALAWVLR